MVTQAGFKDHFSGNSAAYAKARPSYPDALYDWLADVAPRRDVLRLSDSLFILAQDLVSTNNINKFN